MLFANSWQFISMSNANLLIFGVLLASFMLLRHSGRAVQ